MKKLITGFLFVFLILHAEAQEHLLDYTSRNFDSMGNYGPNLTHFVHLYGQFGFHYDPQLVFNFPSQTILGFRYKLKINNFLAVGAEIFAANTTFTLRQNSDKKIPDTILHKSENLNFSSLGGSVFMRINFNKRRGNYLGTYLDIGARSNWNYNVKHTYKDENQKSGTIVKTIERKLPYTEKFYHEFFARFCFNKVGVFVTYRISELFKSSYSLPSLTPLTAGIDVALF